jgi:aminoethylphosphonate catabolism LysR family transcriptional regulator
VNYVQMRAFNAVATHGGFSRAARALGVSQPAVTVHVRSLEEAVGTRLFHRHGATIELSADGRDLHLKVRRIFAMIEDLDHSLTSTSEMRAGHLTVGLCGPHFVMDLLAAYIDRFPSIELKARMGNSAGLLSELADHRVDVAMLTQTEPDPRYFNLLYARQTVMVFVGRDHPWAGRNALRISELHDQRMVQRETGSTTRAIFEHAVARAGVHPRIVLELGSREAVREAVAAGIGFGVVLEAECWRDDRVAAIGLEDADLQAGEYLVCLPDSLDLRIVRTFVELTREHLAGKPL